MLLLLGTWLVGCAPKDTDEEITSTEPNSTRFEGKPDAKYAGAYKTVDGLSTYKFGSDGDFTLDGKVKSPSGVFDQHVKGQWALNGDRILFQYNGTTVPYAYRLAGNRLTLSLTGSLKKETVLVKQ